MGTIESIAAFSLGGGVGFYESYRVCVEFSDTAVVE